MNELRELTPAELGRLLSRTLVEKRELETRNTQLVSEVQDHSTQLMKLRETIADPVAVHINMLANTIAKPSIEAIIHIYGREALSYALHKSDKASSSCLLAEGVAMLRGKSEVIAPLAFGGDNCLCRQKPETGCDLIGCPHREGGNWS